VIVKIENKSQFDKVKFCRLNPGDVFISNDFYCLKIEECPGEAGNVNCADLSSGETEYIQGGLVVLSVPDAKLVV